MEKITKQWLEELPSPIREEALFNLLVAAKDFRQTSMGSALSAGFNWSNTKEGHNYWNQIYLWAAVTDCDITKLKHYIKKK